MLWPTACCASARISAWAGSDDGAARPPARRHRQRHGKALVEPARAQHGRIDQLGVVAGRDHDHPPSRAMPSISARNAFTTMTR